jgi:hypothetical protein
MWMLSLALNSPHKLIVMALIRPDSAVVFTLWPSDIFSIVSLEQACTSA